MSKQAPSKKLRHFVAQRANNRCEYCQTPMWLTGIYHEVDHIIPKSKNGSTTKNNLCLACSSCNGYKHTKIYALDPETNQEVALFHPRKQNWKQHFSWSKDGIYIIGITSSGRATIDALQLNNMLIIKAREIWVSMGYHPPN